MAGGERRSRRAAVAALGLTVLAGCADRLDHLGRAPTMSPVTGPRDAIDPSLPTTATYNAGSEALRAPNPSDPRNASTWSSGPGSLFHARRAVESVGDILTVLIDIDESAEINNDTSLSRTNQEDISISSLFGYEEFISRILPLGGTLEPGVSTASTTDTAGSGAISREEEIELRLAAVVVDVLPNGNLLITGSQEIRVNHELREIQVAGVVRPEDISRQNTIELEKIANARVAYGGRGPVSDHNTAPLVSQVLRALNL